MQCATTRVTPLENQVRLESEENAMHKTNLMFGSGSMALGLLKANQSIYVNQSRTDCSIKFKAKWANLGNTMFPIVCNRSSSSDDMNGDNHSCSGGFSSGFQGSLHRLVKSAALSMTASWNSEAVTQDFNFNLGTLQHYFYRIEVTEHCGCNCNKSP